MRRLFRAVRTAGVCEKSSYHKNKLFRLLVVAASLFVRSYLNDLMTLGLAGGFDSGFGKVPSVFLQKLDKAFRGLRQRMGLLADPADGDGIVKALDGTLDHPLRPVAFGDEAGTQIIALTLLHDHQALIESVDNGDLLA